MSYKILLLVKHSQYTFMLETLSTFSMSNLRLQSSNEYKQTKRA